VVAVLAALCVVVAACADDTAEPIALPPVSDSDIDWLTIGTGGVDLPPETLAPPSARFTIGHDTTRAVSLAWAAPLEFSSVLEDLVTVDDVAYVTTDVTVEAISLGDGSHLWTHSGDDYFSDGLSQVTLADGLVWAIAPYNTNIHLDRDTGQTVSTSADHSFESIPSGFVPIATSPPRDWRIAYRGTGVDAYDVAGELAWSLRLSDDDGSVETTASEFSDAQIIQSGDLILIPGGDGYLYAVRVSPD
jgi:hypothetical protein